MEIQNSSSEPLIATMILPYIACHICVLFKKSVHLTNEDTNEGTFFCPNSVPTCREG